MKKEWIFFAMQIAAIVLILYAIFTRLSVYLLIGLVFHTIGHIYLFFRIPEQKSIKYLFLSIIPLAETILYFSLDRF